MKKKITTLLLGILLLGAKAIAGNVVLTHMATPTSAQSQSDFSVCGSQTHSFYARYTFTSHTGCTPNKYRTTFKLYLNGVETSSSYFTVSSTSSGHGFYNMLTKPGTYTAKAILERKPCIGNWYPAETVFSNAIVVTSNATPNFSINGVMASADPNNIPSITVNAAMITIDASGTACENYYWVGVWETNHNWWERTYKYEWGGWFQGQATNNINLQYLATTSHERWINGPDNRKDNALIGGIITDPASPFFNQERYYTVSICTGEPSWTCKQIQIKVTW